MALSGGISESFLGNPAGMLNVHHKSGFQVVRSCIKLNEYRTLRLAVITFCRGGYPAKGSGSPFARGAGSGAVRW